MCGYYEPTRHELRVTHQGEIVVQKLQTMSDDELLKLAEGVEIVDGEFKNWSKRYVYGYCKVTDNPFWPTGLALVLRTIARTCGTSRAS